jgi:hypothetical protein
MKWTLDFIRTARGAKFADIYADLHAKDTDMHPKHNLTKRYAHDILRALLYIGALEKDEQTGLYHVHGVRQSLAHHFRNKEDREAYVTHASVILYSTPGKNEIPVIYFELLEEELTWLFGRNYQLNEEQRWYQNIIWANHDIEGTSTIERFPRPEAIKDMFLSHIKTGYSSSIWQASQSLKEKYGDRFPLSEMLNAYINSEANQLHEAFSALESRKDILGVPVERLLGEGRMYARPRDGPIPPDVIPGRSDSGGLNLTTDTKSKPVASLPSTTQAPLAARPLDKKPKPLTPTEVLITTMNIPKYEARQTDERFRDILQGLLQVYLKHWANIPMGGSCQTCETLVDESAGQI